MKPEGCLLQASRGRQGPPRGLSAYRWGQTRRTATVAQGWSQPQPPPGAGLAWLVVSPRPGLENTWATGPGLTQAGGVPGHLLPQGSAREVLTERGGRAQERACPLEVRLNSSCSGTLDQSLNSNVIITIVLSKHFHLKPRCYVFPVFQRRAWRCGEGQGQPKGTQLLRGRA